MMYGYYNMARWGAMDWTFRFLFWGLVIIGVLVILRYITRDERFSHGPHDQHGHHDHDHMDKTPLDILKYRYAKGEIDKKEFEEKKKDLSE